MTKSGLGTRTAMALYGLAWGAARPFLRRNKRLADGFAERLVPPAWPYGPDSPAQQGQQGQATHHSHAPFDVWIQAASGGEARLACALMEALPQIDTKPLHILATTWTRQGLDLLEKYTKIHTHDTLRVTPRFVPFDAPQCMRRALRQARPRLVVLLETELWPGLLHACAEEAVPVLVLNGRMTEKSLRNYLHTAPFWRSFAPQRIIAMAEVDAERFAAVFPDTPVSVAPNIKFDQAVPAITAENPLQQLPQAVRTALKTVRPMLLLASVREEEETLLVDTLANALASSPSLASAHLCIAPRHMHRITMWQEHLKRLGLSCVLRSQLEAHCHTETPQAIIWDAFGELEALYHAADAVFVGGSLAPLGGQNFLEALAAGHEPLVGPYLDNFLWAFDGSAGSTLNNTGLVRIVPDAATLWNAFGEAAASGSLTQTQRAQTRQRFTDWLRPHQGGAAAQAHVVLDCLSVASGGQRA